MDDQTLLPGMDAWTASPPAADSVATERAAAGPPRLRVADRTQSRVMVCSLDELLPESHPARLVAKVVARYDLGAFTDAIAARGSGPGRAATDPRLLITLLLYAAIKGVGTGREIARLCECHDAYRWICGGVTVNYHTINDFRVGHEQALDDLFTDVIATLVKHDVISVTRIAQDGMRVRASAGTSSFRSESSLHTLQEEAREHLRRLKLQNDPAHLSRQEARRISAAKDREKRLNQALEQLPPLRDKREQNAKRSNDKRYETRVSTTDADARVMRMADGGFRPAYNVQIVTDTTSRAIVAVDVVNAGSDSEQATPLREQVEKRSGEKVQEHLVDGGFAKHEAIEQAEQSGVTMYAPVHKPNKPGVDPHARKAGDSDAVFAHRQRMATEEAKEIYKLRGATVETINADLAEHRGLRQFPVRGSPKVRCVVLWLALAYNILHFGPQLLQTQS